MQSRLSQFLTTFISWLIIFGFGYLVGQSPLAPVQVFAASAADSKALDPFWETWQLIHAQYYDQPVDDTLLAEGAIEGMLTALEDRYTRYLPPEDEAAARQDVSGELEGIGAEVADVEGNITIITPLDGSPAEAAGLLPGDILREANGIELTGLGVIEAAQYVRGPAGSVVTLLVERDGKQIELDITRAAFTVRSVRGELLEGNVAYVRLSQFGEQTDTELAEILGELLAEAPVGLVLDVRRNPGGLLQTAVNVADQFLPEGTILVQEFGNGRQRTFESDDDGLAQDIPLIVLIDQGSASASEVLAGAIQATDRGLLLGQTSFGKGTVQQWHGLSNDGGVRITVARWLLPDETWIDEVGITPDIDVAFPDTPPTEGEFVDVQLEAAVEYLTR